MFMTNNRFLDGQVAMVTGGSRGIGLEIVKQLSDAGASVHFCGRSVDTVSRASQELTASTRQGGDKVTGHVVDLTVEEQIAKWFQAVWDRQGRLDILVNNAGIGRFHAVRELELEAWRQTIDTNLTAAYLCSRQALDRFDRERGGFIVNIASLASRNAFAGGAAYNASKFGLLGFAEAMLLDHRQENVGVSTILPGSVATEFSPRSGGGDDSWKIAPEDVAEVVLDVLRISRRTLVSLVEMRPARPRK
jgi:3-oxoacyl-[acyl-carrier protein] reductase